MPTFQKFRGRAIRRFARDAPSRRPHRRASLAHARRAFAMAADGGSASLGSSARDANTASLVRRLVRATLTKHGAGATPDADVDRLFRYAVRLVGSSLSASVEPDEGAAADAIRRRLARAGADPSAVVDFSDLHRRLSQQPGLRKRWALLHALLSPADLRLSALSKAGMGCRWSALSRA